MEHRLDTFVKGEYDDGTINGIHGVSRYQENFLYANRAQDIDGGEGAQSNVAGMPVPNGRE